MPEPEQRRQGDLQEVGPAKVADEALHAPHHVEARQHGSVVRHAVQDAQALLVDFERARQLGYGARAGFVRLAFDQARNDGELHRALAAVRIGDDACQGLERDSRQITGA